MQDVWNQPATAGYWGTNSIDDLTPGMRVLRRALDIATERGHCIATWDHAALALEQLYPGCIPDLTPALARLAVHRSGGVSSVPCVALPGLSRACQSAPDEDAAALRHLLRALPAQAGLNSRVPVADTGPFDQALAQVDAWFKTSGSGRRLAGKADAIERSVAAAMWAAAKELFGHTNQTALAGVLLAFEGELADPRVVKNDGTVVPGSLTYRLLDVLEARSEQTGDRRAREAIDSLLGQSWDGQRTALARIREAVNPAGGVSRNSGSANGNSFEEVRFTATGPSGRSTAELLAELDGLTGLESVKRVFHQQLALQRVAQHRADVGLANPMQSRHLLFTGNPGTGKTTIARLLADALSSIGALSGGQLVETDRSGLVGGYMGHTAMKTQLAIDAALGGVLFIDEAYSLARGDERDHFGRECIDTLVKAMEDHRDDLIVVLAGYPAEMAVLVDANPGIRSRIGEVIAFPDYADGELLHILKSLFGAHDYQLAPGCMDVAAEALARIGRGTAFGNGRLMRNVFEAAIRHQAVRLNTGSTRALDREQLSLITLDDLRSGFSDHEPPAAQQHTIGFAPLKASPCPSPART